MAQRDEYEIRRDPSSIPLHPEDEKARRERLIAIYGITKAVQPRVLGAEVTYIDPTGEVRVKRYSVDQIAGGNPQTGTLTLSPHTMSKGLPHPSLLPLIKHRSE